MTDGGKTYERQSWKVRVRQEFDVYIYFQEGIHAEDDDELYDIIAEEATNAAFGEDGLTAVLHEETESSNGYLAYVTTHDPEVDVLYNYKDIPQVMKQALKAKGLVAE